jgi:PKD repeat protein
VPILARALAAAVLCLPLAFAAPAHADLDLSVVHATAEEVSGNGDDVVGHGEEIRVDATLATATALSGATGTLATATPGVTLLANTAAFSDAPAGGQTSNTMPFEVQLGDLPCGANVAFALDVQAGGDTGAVTFKIPTGARGRLRPAEGARADLADADTTDLPLDVAQGGRVKAMEVRIGELSHPRLSDLRLELIAPDGAVTVLTDAGTLSGTAMTGTRFADGAPPIGGAAAPYTGTYRPAGSLAALEGRVLNGTWRLRAVDTVAGEAGSVEAWGLDAARAHCSGIPRAAFSMNPTSVVPGGTVQFDGRLSSDGDGGTAVDYAWDLDGDGQFDDGTAAQVQHSYAVRGSYGVRLRVTDADGLTDVHERDLAVTLPPAAALTATPTDPLSGDTFRLDAAGSSDPDGSIVRYQWDLDGDGSFERDTQGVAHLDASIPTPQTVTVGVLVTDSDGGQDVATVPVTVRNRPPAAAIADPGLVVRDRPATLSAAGSTDADGTIARYQWDLNGDGTHETDGGSDATIAHTFSEGGPRTVGVRVTDDHGATATATRTVTVTHAPLAVVTATPSPVSLRRHVTFDASGSSDPDGGALTFAWDVENDGSFEPGAATRTASWPTAGTRTVKVRVTDASGTSTVGSATVLVRNVLPLGAIAATPAPPTAGQPVQLNAAGSSDADGTVVRYQWDRDGDGSYEHDTGATPSATATFANAGNVTVGVRVTDDDGGTGTKTLTLAVARAATAVQPAGGSPATTGSAPPSGPGATPGTPTEPAGAEPGAEPGTEPVPPLAAWLGGAAVQRTRHVLARGVLVSCRADAAARCAVTATLPAAGARRLKLGRRAVTVARGTVSVAAGTTARTRLALSARARRALRRGGGARLVLSAVARTADGREAVLRRAVRLRG